MPYCCKAMFHCLKGISSLDYIKVYCGLHFKDIQTFRLLNFFKVKFTFSLIKIMLKKSVILTKSFPFIL